MHIWLYLTERNLICQGDTYSKLQAFRYVRVSLRNMYYELRTLCFNTGKNNNAASQDGNTSHIFNIWNSCSPEQLRISCLLKMFYLCQMGRMFARTNQRERDNRHTKCCQSAWTLRFCDYRDGTFHFISRIPLLTNFSKHYISMETGHAVICYEAYACC